MSYDFGQIWEMFSSKILVCDEFAALPSVNGYLRMCFTLDSVVNWELENGYFRVTTFKHERPNKLESGYFRA